MVFKGKVEHVEVREGTKNDGSQYKAYKFVVKETEGQHPQSGVFEHYNPDERFVAKVGDEVEVNYNMKTSERDGKYYGKNDVWRMNIQKQSGAGVP